MRVLVCDDEEERGRQVVDDLQDMVEGLEVIPLIGEPLTKALKALFKRVKGCLQDPNNFQHGDKTLDFDNADLVIFDNNLADLDIEGARLTAESVVGYVRAFTDAAYIVSLNKNPSVDFDLRFLIGDYESRADLALNAWHLQNLALWTGDRSDASDGFLPWYWPQLLTASARRRKQIAFIREQFGNSIFSSVGFPTDLESLSFLSLHAIGSLDPDLEPGGSAAAGEVLSLDQVTFQQYFSARNRSIGDVRERKGLLNAIESGNSDVLDVVARAVAADIDHWFRRDILGPQDFLVDVPHLLMRMPFLLGEQASNRERWNMAVEATDPPYGLNADLYARHVEITRFESELWVPKPAFWWPALQRNEQLGGLFFGANPDAWADMVFCEDRSAFLPRGGEPERDTPREFTAEFEGSWTLRYVTKIDGRSYQPGVRFAV